MASWSESDEFRNEYLKQDLLTSRGPSRDCNSDLESPSFTFEERNKQRIGFDSIKSLFNQEA